MTNSFGFWDFYLIIGAIIGALIGFTAHAVLSMAKKADRQAQGKEPVEDLEAVEK